MSQLRVLVASHWPEVRSCVVTILRTAGHQAAPYMSSLPLPFDPDVVVRDTGKAELPWADRPTVLMSGSWTADWLKFAQDMGAIVLSKPFTAAQLLFAVAQAAQSG